MLTPYLPFIIKTLDTYPTLTAVRLYEMAKQRGYPGGSSQFRHRISELRPRKQPEAYLRLKTLPGEQAQVDWGLCRQPDYAELSFYPPILSAIRPDVIGILFSFR
jgi:transposase